MTINTENTRADSELIRDFKNGNIKGFNEIVSKYQKQVYWVVRKMVQDHDEADDITQEVFIKVYDALKEFREESGLFTWLYRIAVNYSINHIRKKKVKNTLSLEMVTETIKTEALHGESFDEERKRMVLQEAIGTLPSQQKAVFNLRYYEELPYEEISRIMNRSVGGVKANYFHAVKKIGEYFKNKLGAENV